MIIFFGTIQTTKQAMVSQPHILAVDKGLKKNVVIDISIIRNGNIKETEHEEIPINMCIHTYTALTFITNVFVLVYSQSGSKAAHKLHVTADNNTVFGLTSAKPIYL